MATNTSTIIIDATVDKVWETLTKPELVKQWQYGSDLITDWNIGGDIKFRSEWEGKVFEQSGKVIEVKQNEIIKYSLFAPLLALDNTPENNFIMSYVLTKVDEQTKLDIIQEDNRPGAVQEKPQEGENPVLQSLKLLAEKM